MLLRGRARLLSIDETLDAAAPPGVVAAQGINMEGIKSVDDAPEKFVGEDREDWLKRAAIMVQRIRDRVRVIWQVEPERVDWLQGVRGRSEAVAQGALQDQDDTRGARRLSRFVQAGHRGDVDRRRGSVGRRRGLPVRGRPTVLQGATRHEDPRPPAPGRAWSVCVVESKPDQSSYYDIKGAMLHGGAVELEAGESARGPRRTRRHRRPGGARPHRPGSCTRWVSTTRPAFPSTRSRVATRTSR